ncbi:hypothetical protein M407DRAFT_31737 [Tulasnella calospora MUT 4182]|uniref:Uncharacterized protein n=1 Tax=Tulasnella calospora MUT 4182 TaxID=1051891 RepID=A0A0C3Q5Y8_9AGAM|nr:hypothetical protein M407DRAFT_31737 [Tulasnella calospora MUT 4182]
MNLYLNPAHEEAGILARMQLKRIEELTAQSCHWENLFRTSQAQNTELSRDLAKALSQRDVLQMELGQSLSAVKRTLCRARATEDYASALRGGDYAAKAPLPHSDESSDSPSTSDSSSIASHTSTNQSSINTPNNHQKN